jgi:hypothetical protein
MKTLTFIIIGLLIGAPFICWKVWRPRAASTAGLTLSGPPAGAGGPPAGGEPAGLAGRRSPGRQWMGDPPSHQLIVGPLTSVDSNEPDRPGPDPCE